MLKLILKIIYIANTLIETLIIIKVLLSIFASSSTHYFVEWINNTSDIFISPFEGIVPSVLVIDNFEISIIPIVALIFYTIIAFILSELLKAFKND